jgi:hypothetical protein
MRQFPWIKKARRQVVVQATGGMRRIGPAVTDKDFTVTYGSFLARLIVGWLACPLS